MAKKFAITKQLLAAAQKAAMKRQAMSELAGKSVNAIAASINVTRDQFLMSQEWRVIRKKVLEMYGEKCMKCNYVPTNLSKINVDHIKPRRFYPHLALDFDNLQVLCSGCNKAKGNNHMTDYRP